MNIYDSLMDIFDEKNKDIYVETLLHAPAQPRKGIFMDIQKNNLWTFMTHWWTFLTKKNKDIYVETLRHAPAQPRKGLFMDIQKNNLWTFMAHWWTFLTKKTKTFMSKKTFYDEKTKHYYITLPFNMVILAHLIRNTLPSITIILFHHTILCQQKVYWLTLQS